MKKKITPSIAIANRFFPTMSQARGERKRFSPVETQEEAEERCLHMENNTLLPVS